MLSLTKSKISTLGKKMHKYTYIHHIHRLFLYKHCLVVFFINALKAQHRRITQCFFKCFANHEIDVKILLCF